MRCQEKAAVLKKNVNPLAWKRRKCGSGSIRDTNLAVENSTVLDLKTICKNLSLK